MGAYSTRTVRVPVPAQYPVRVRLAKRSTRASEIFTKLSLYEYLRLKILRTNEANISHNLSICVQLSP